MMACKSAARNILLMQGLELEEQFVGEPLRGTGRRSERVTLGRVRFIRQSIRLGFTRSEIARALELHWTSVNHLYNMG
jgi:hypothetical protein